MQHFDNHLKLHTLVLYETPLLIKSTAEMQQIHLESGNNKKNNMVKMKIGIGDFPNPTFHWILILYSLP